MEGRELEGKVALVTGATGYTGREVVRRLCAGGARVVAHVRPGSEAALRWEEAFRTWGAEVVEAPWEQAALRDLIASVQPDAIFSLIGTTKRRARREGLQGDIYRSVDLGLNERLIDAAVEAGSRARFVYLSSLGADVASPNAYLAARGKTEERLRESGLPFAIARPSFIHGPGRDRPRLGEALAAAIVDAALAVVGALGAGKLRERYRSIDNVGLAAALIRLAFAPGAEGKVHPGEEIQRLAR